jgi:hypothetical protein
MERSPSPPPGSRRCSAPLRTWSGWRWWT